MPKLHVVVCSTRPGRIGPKVAAWFAEKARAHGAFEVEVVDLAEVGLPLYDEPNHPTRRLYTKDHTKAWSAKVASADAFAFVLPEYNYTSPPAFVNALDFLFHEWNYKACAFVSYGGLSGGLRSVQAAKLQVTALRMMPLPEGVVLPFAAKGVTPDGVFDPGATPDESVTKALDELARWTKALGSLRNA